MICGWVCVKKVGTSGGERDEEVDRWVDRGIFKTEVN